MAENGDFERRKRQFELDMRLAERAHDEMKEYGDGVNKAAVESGHKALQAIMVINGGAGIALLAFIGSIASKDGINAVAGLASTLHWFAYGVGLTALAMGVAYLVNYCYANSASEMRRTWEHPYVSDTASSISWRWVGIFFHAVTLGAALLALWFFVFGMLQVQDEVATMRVKVSSSAAVPAATKK